MQPDAILNNVERTSLKMLRKLKQKGVLDYYEDGYNASNIITPDGDYNGTIANVSLIKFDEDKLVKELKRYGFRVIN